MKSLLSKHQELSMLPKVELFGNKITLGSHEEVLIQIVKLAKLKDEKSSYVCFANVHMLSEANRDKEFKKILNKADLVTADGRPLSILINLLYQYKQKRICGMDLMPQLFEEASKSELNVFLYGGTDDLLDLVIEKAKSDYPQLNIVGKIAPPFRPLNEEEDKKVIDIINSSGADLLFVTLGCPKQEKWMYQHQEKINACMLGLGQAFRTYAGIEKRLPKWTRDLSLEWLYRLYLEPKRLWKRYLVGNCWFLWNATITLLFFKLSRKVAK